MTAPKVIEVPAGFDDAMLGAIGRADKVITSDGIVIKDKRELLDGPVPRPATDAERDEAILVTM